MSAYKDDQRGTWFAKFCYKDWQGEKKWITKRGFATKREAVQYERHFLMRKSGDTDMTFGEFIKVYREDRSPRIKESTAAMKDNIIDTKLLPYFGKKRLRDITTKDIISWQNVMLSYRDPKTENPIPNPISRPFTISLVRCLITLSAFISSRRILRQPWAIWAAKRASR